MTRYERQQVRDALKRCSPGADLPKLDLVIVTELQPICANCGAPRKWCQIGCTPACTKRIWEAKYRTEPHGTYFWYTKHPCRCKKCRKANADYKRDYTRERRASSLRVHPRLHGTQNAYKHYVCHCPLCKTAHTAAERAAKGRK